MVIVKPDKKAYSDYLGVHLHSSMVIVKLVRKCRFLAPILYLHSSMVIVKLTESQVGFNAVTSFTFQYGYSKTTLF